MDIAHIIKNHDVHIIREAGILRGRYHDDRVDVYLMFSDGRWEGCNRYCEDEYDHEPMCASAVIEELFLYYTCAGGVLTKGEVIETGPEELASLSKRSNPST